MPSALLALPKYGGVSRALPLRDDMGAPLRAGLYNVFAASTCRRQRAMSDNGAARVVVVPGHSRQPHEYAHRLA